MHRFNIRVYGILINENKEVLVSDELIRGKYYTKFPGGGMEYGEGTRDCLKREFIEEMNLKVDVGPHIYTTDFFQKSTFHANQQILSVYYFVRPLEPIQVKLSDIEFDFDENQLKQYERDNEIETFRFISWDKFREDAFSLPIDKIVVNIVRGMH